jgi:hypothetical protein
MNSCYVWPRLPNFAARQLLAEYSTCEIEKLRERSALEHPDAAPVAVGGPRVPVEIVTEVRGELRRLSESLGFPADLGRVRAAAFDQPATRILHDLMRIIPADAAAEDVWSFLAIVVAPDVAIWRFPGRSDERLLGRPRNAFRRLWWRAEVIGVDLIDVSSGLGEDELVNIMERPSIAANRVLSKSLARVIVERGDKATVARTELMRDVAKRVLRRQSVLCLEVLEPSQIEALVGVCFDEAVIALDRHG